MPPYPDGGTGNQPGATSAIRIPARLRPRSSVLRRGGSTVPGMPEPWTTSASASLGGTDGVVTLVEGSAFCLSSRSGDIDPGRPQGFIFRDTRFLSELCLRLNGNQPEPLTATTADPFSGIYVSRGEPAAGRADSHLLVTRRRFVGRGMREDVEIANFSEEATFCSIELQ